MLYISNMVSNIKEKIEDIIDGCLKTLHIYKQYADKPLEYKYGLITGNYNEDFDAMCAKANTLKRQMKLLERISWSIPAGRKVYYQDVIKND